VVECHLAKVDVAGSSPVSRSTKRPESPGFFFAFAIPLPAICLFGGPCA